MGFYDAKIVPRLTHCAMRSPRLTPCRQRVVAGAEGHVLEIGIGSGINLPLYGRGVTSVVGVDPSGELLVRARRQTRWLPFPVRLLHQGGEQLPLDTASFDSVVTTWTLCSVFDPAAVVLEAARVLKPGGRLFFVEHGRSPAPVLAAWQDRLTPIWKLIAGGCHINRRPDEAIESAGLTIDQIDQGHLIQGPRLFTWHFLGSARR